MSSAPPIPSLARVLLGLVEDAKKERRLAVCLPVFDLEFVANEIIRFDRELARYRAPVSDTHEEVVDSLREDLRVVVESLKKLESNLAECYRMTGSYPDSNEDWRLALHAVSAVRELRKEFDENERKLASLEWSEITPENPPRVGDEVGHWWERGQMWVVHEYGAGEDVGLDTHRRPLNAPSS